MTDNMALVTMLNTMYLKDKKLNMLLKCCAMLVKQNNVHVVVRAYHIRSDDNTIPDRLSRNDYCFIIILTIVLLLFVSIIILTSLLLLALLTTTFLWLSTGTGADDGTCQ